MIKVRVYPRMKGTMKLADILRKQYAVISNEPGTEKAPVVKKPMSPKAQANANRFSLAAKAAKLIKSSLTELDPVLIDSNGNRRLFKRLMAIIKTGTPAVNNNGGLNENDFHLLKDFRFEEKAQLAFIFPTPLNPVIKRKELMMGFDIPGILPMYDIAAPNGCTHYQFVSAAVEIDFELQQFNTRVWKSDYLPYDCVPTHPIHVIHPVTKDFRQPLFLVFGVWFFGKQCSTHYRLRGASTSVLEIIAAESTVTDP